MARELGLTVKGQAELEEYEKLSLDEKLTKLYGKSIQCEEHFPAEIQLQGASLTNIKGVVCRHMVSASARSYRRPDTFMAIQNKLSDTYHIPRYFLVTQDGLDKLKRCIEETLNQQRSTLNKCLGKSIAEKWHISVLVNNAKQALHVQDKQISNPMLERFAMMRGVSNEQKDKSQFWLAMDDALDLFYSSPDTKRPCMSAVKLQKDVERYPPEKAGTMAPEETAEAPVGNGQVNDDGSSQAPSGSGFIQLNITDD